MKSLWNRNEKFLGVPMLFWWGLAVATVWDLFVYGTPNHIVGNFYHYNMELPVDRATPFVAWTCFIYMGSYIVWGLGYMDALRGDKEMGWNYLGADFLGKLFCYLFFILLPTTNVRPEVTGSGPAVFLMKQVYASDAAVNLFPSIHCFSSWMCVIGARGRKAGWGKRAVYFLLAIAVFLSTLTTKQHVLVDVFGGVFFAELAWQISHRTTFGHDYGALLEGWYDRLSLRFGKK